MERLSLQLYEVLEHVGASEDIRHMHQTSAMLGEIFNTINFTSNSNQSSRAYICGSSFEGSVVPSKVSDIDVVYGLNQIFPLVAEIDKAPPSLSLYMRNSHSTYPGYLKCHLLLDGRPITIADKDDLNGYEIDIEGNFCFQHPRSREGVVPSGPSDPVYDKRGKHIFDSVFSFRCPEIPTFACKGLEKQTKFEWPGEEMTCKMINMGCLVVGVGNTESGERNIEWRLSLTLQERQLMTCLNHVQHKIYILLKIIKDEILNIDIDDEKLTSYHCKTCVLHAARIVPVNLWTKENLIGCLLMCLSFLQNMVRYRYCPNVFLPDQNLFSKRGFRQSTPLFTNKIQTLLETGCSFLYELTTEAIGDKLLNYKPGIRQIVTEDVVSFVYTHKIRKIVTLLATRRDVLKGQIKMLLGELDNYKRSEQFADYPDEVMHRAITCLAPSLHLCLASQVAAHLKRQKHLLEAPAQHHLSSRFEYHLRESLSTDRVNGLLLKSTVLYQLEKYEECDVLLRQIESALGRFVLTLCSCTGPTYENSPTPAAFKRKVFSLNEEDILRNHVMTCVVFRPSDWSIVPWPLRFEMLRRIGPCIGTGNQEIHYWFDWAVVDAKVYLYLLIYMVSVKLGKVLDKHAAIVRMRKFLRETTDLAHRDTAWNILGWMYYQEGKPGESIQCFKESWKIRPGYNAAKFHMLGVWTKMRAHGQWEHISV